MSTNPHRAALQAILNHLRSADAVQNAVLTSEAINLVEHEITKADRIAILGELYHWRAREEHFNHLGP
jgi:hypothetical protein